MQFEKARMRIPRLSMKFFFAGKANPRRHKEPRRACKGPYVRPSSPKFGAYWTLFALLSTSADTGYWTSA